MERLGVSISGGLGPAEAVECVRLAEELGYESAWMAEGHGGDQFSVLTACALATERIRLGTGITSVYVRTAPTIAMAAASHKVQVEPEHGLEFTKPVTRLRETVDVVRRLLKESRVSYQGVVVKIDEFDLWFEPLRREIPVYVAAVRPRMLEITGEIAQGALLTWCTLDHAATAAHHVALGARSAGKDPEEVEVASLISCAVSDNMDTARDSFRPIIASYASRFPRYRRLMAESGFADEVDAVRRAWQSGNEEEARRLVPAGLIDKIGVAGSRGQCRAKLQAYRDAGITLPIVSPRVSGPGAKEKAMEIIRGCAPQ